MEQFELYSNYLDQHIEKKWYLAVSGGVDSVVLLDLIRNKYPKKEIFIIHINHQLQSHANEWEAFVKNLAQVYDIKCFTHRVTLKSCSEESARIARYDVFRMYLQDPAILMMGHHLDDSLETMMQGFFRGSRTGGLTGIPFHRVFENGEIYRPLLKFFREDILKYAKQRKLQWVEDPTNQESFYTRNFIRQKVIPLLETHYLSLKKQLITTQQMITDEHQTLLDFFQPYICLKKIDLKNLPNLSQKGLKTLIVYWTQYHGLGIPAYKSIEEFIQQVLTSNLDKHPILDISDSYFIGSYRNVLYLEKKSNCVQTKKISILAASMSKEFNFGNKVYYCDEKALDFFSNKKEFLTIRALNKKDKLILNKKKIQVTNYWQENKIPPWERQQIPAIFLGELFIQYGMYCYNKEIFETTPFYCE